MSYNVAKGYAYPAMYVGGAKFDWVAGRTTFTWSDTQSLTTSVTFTTEATVDAVVVKASVSAAVGVAVTNTKTKAASVTAPSGRGQYRLRITYVTSAIKLPWITSTCRKQWVYPRAANRVRTRLASLQWQRR